MKGRGWEGWGGGERGGGGRRESAYWRSVSDGNSFWQIFLYCTSMIFDVKLRIFVSKISRCERERERGREREREREKECGVHGCLFLGGLCNEVHGMLLVIDTKRRRVISAMSHFSFLPQTLACSGRFRCKFSIMWSLLWLPAAKTTTC